MWLTSQTPDAENRLHHDKTGIRHAGLKYPQSPTGQHRHHGLMMAKQTVHAQIA